MKLLFYKYPNIQFHNILIYRSSITRIMRELFICSDIQFLNNQTYCSTPPTILSEGGELFLFSILKSRFWFLFSYLLFLTSIFISYQISSIFSSLALHSLGGGGSFRAICLSRGAAISLFLLILALNFKL